jgi:mycobactin polyketide synthetase MbtD
LASAAIRYGGQARVWSPGVQARAGETLVLLAPAAAADEKAGPAIERLGAFLAASEPWLAAAGEAGACWVLTRGGSLLHAALPIAVRSLGARFPGARFAHLELDSAALESDEGALAAVEALHVSGEGELSLRGGALRAKRLAAADEPCETGDLGHVVITGGTGRVGLAIAAQLARRGARRITLVNRSGERADLRDALAQLRRAGARIDVVAADLTDPAAARALAAIGGDEPVTLVVHAAIEYVHAPAAVAAEAAARAAAAKVAGLENLLAALPLADSARILLCSSTAATFGGPGLALYAAVNRMLDALAERLRAGGLDCRSVQWCLWDTSAAPRDAQYDAIAAGSGNGGFIAMDPAAAVAASFTATSQNALVFSARWDMIALVCERLGMPNLMPSLRAPDDSAHRETAPDSPPAAAGEAEAPGKQIRASLMRVMGIGDGDIFDDETPLVALGLDSIQALEFHQEMKKATQAPIPVTSLLGGITLAQIIALAEQPPSPQQHSLAGRRR